MIPYTNNDVMLVVATCLAALGVISICCGIFLLVSRTAGKSIQTIASQTSRLAQKGMTEEVAGLVGNASALIDSLNQLVRTSAGIGIFLVMFGFIMLFAAFWMVRS